MLKAPTRLTVLACVTAITLAACGNDETTESTTDAIAPAVVVGPDQVFRLYDGQARYVSAAREDPDAELSTLYTEYVIDPYWEQCFSAMVPEEDRTLAASMALHAELAASMTLHDTDRLSASVEALRTEDAVETVATALTETRAMVDTPPVTACVMAGYPSAVSGQLLDDVGGVMTAGWEHVMGVVVNPEVDGWQALLGYVVARNCHQLAQESCCRDPDQTPKLLEAVVSIGKAHTFAELLYPAAHSPQTNVLIQRQEAALWERMSPDLTSQDPELIQDYVFISRSTVPTWTGHTIGYHIVQAYLDAHPEATIDDWTMLDAATLLADSGYPGEP
jgi:uncharacterized protein YjaZ